MHLIVAKFQETNKCHGYRQESVTATQKNRPPCAALLLTSTRHGAPEDSAVGHVNAVVDSRIAESLAGLSSPLVWFGFPPQCILHACAAQTAPRQRRDGTVVSGPPAAEGWWLQPPLQPSCCSWWARRCQRSMRAVSGIAIFLHGHLASDPGRLIAVPPASQG